MSLKYLFFLALVLSFSAPDTSRPALPAGVYEYTVDTVGKPSYAVYIPPDFDPNFPSPLVFLLTVDRNGTDGLLRSDWAKQAERSGFVVARFRVDPESSPLDLSLLLQSLNGRITVDPGRVFAVCPPQILTMAQANQSHLAAIACVDGSKAPSTEPFKGTSWLRTDGKNTQAIWQHFDHHPRPASASTPTRLTVICKGLRNASGQVLVTLFRGEEGFPGDAKRAFRTGSARITGDTAMVTFTELPPGDYACAFVHDENENGELDTSFGFPLEGFGVSNNPRIRFAAPRFTDARFFLAGDLAEKRIILRATYF